MNLAISLLVFFWKWKFSCQDIESKFSVLREALLRVPLHIVDQNGHNLNSIILGNKYWLVLMVVQCWLSMDVQGGCNPFVYGRVWIGFCFFNSTHRYMLHFWWQNCDFRGNANGTVSCFKDKPRKLKGHIRIASVVLQLIQNMRK